MKRICIVLIVSIVAAGVSLPATAQKKRAVTAKSKTASKPSNMLAMLQGRWSSLDDKKTFFQIEGNKQINIYGRDILDTSTINFYNGDCPKTISLADEQRTSGEYLITSTRPDDFYCYSIEKISSQLLVLMYLPRGNLLRYKKVPTIKLDNINPMEETED